MFTRINSGGIWAVEGVLVSVEADVSDGLPGFSISGQLASEVRESQERVRTALKNSGFRLPAKKITVNLSPAGIRKGGTAYDLPIAVAILGAFQMVGTDVLEDSMVIGELGLDGSVHGIRQCLPIIMEGKKQGIRRFMVPYDDMESLVYMKDVELVPVKHLSDAVDYFRNGCVLPYHFQKKRIILNSQCLDFSEIKGQPLLKRALEIAVTGRHHILLIGAPGCGKTMALERIPSIMNSLSEDEYLEVQALYQAAGIHRDAGDFCPPFRKPHSSISRGALIGGGAVPKVGEITLAHKGVLFLDELAQFDAKCIEALRQPLEDKQIILNRLGRDYTMPADFLLAAAMNPCPCGNSFTPEACRCSAGQKRSYYHRLSGPVLDRFDLILTVGQEAKKMDAETETSAVIRSRVLEHIREEQRELSDTPYSYFSQIQGEDIEKICPLNKESQKILKEEQKKHHISMRGIHKIVRTAKTIAGMEQQSGIGEGHLIEALSLRNMEFLSEAVGYE